MPLVPPRLVRLAESSERTDARGPTESTDCAAEVAAPRDLFRRILAMIDELRPKRIAHVEPAGGRSHRRA